MVLDWNSKRKSGAERVSVLNQQCVCVHDATNIAVETGVLNIPGLTQANNTWMPYAMKAIRCQQELLILLWDVIDLNPAFVDYVLNQRNCCELVSSCRVDRQRHRLRC